MMEMYEDYEEENRELLDIFREDMEKKSLSEKTIRKHTQ